MISTIPIPFAKDSVESCARVVLVQDVQFILECVAERYVTNVMKQSSQSDKSTFGLSRLRTDNPLILHFNLARFATVMSERFEHSLSDPHSSQGVFKSTMRGTAVDEVSKSQLVDPCQALKRRLIDYRDFLRIKPDKSVDRNKEFLAVFGLRRLIHMVSLGTLIFCNG